MSAINRARATEPSRLRWAALLAGWPCVLFAQAGSPRLEIDAGTALTQGTARLAVVIELGDSREQPLMLDVASEGEALQVVRGRFRRSDAQPAGDGRLQFSVPIVVRAQGTAIVRAELLTYRCAPDCREVRASAQRTLTVGPSPGRGDTAP